MEVLEKRVEFFVENGCAITDHGLSRVYFRATNEEEVDAILKKALNGDALTQEEIEFITFLIAENLNTKKSEKIKKLI